MNEEIELPIEVAKLILDLIEIAYGEGLLPKSKLLTKLTKYIRWQYPQLFKEGSYTLYIHEKIKEDHFDD